MAGSVNKVILVGNLGQDPEVKSFQNGGRIANLRVATSESWKDKQTGERKERTEWHSVVLQSDGLVGVAERFLKKVDRAARAQGRSRSELIREALRHLLDEGRGGRRSWKEALAPLAALEQQWVGHWDSTDIVRYYRETRHGREDRR